MTSDLNLMCSFVLYSLNSVTSALVATHWIWPSSDQSTQVTQNLVEDVSLCNCSPLFCPSFTFICVFCFMYVTHCTSDETYDMNSPYHHHLFSHRWTGTPNERRWQASITPPSWWWFRIPLQTFRTHGTSLTTAFRMQSTWPAQPNRYRVVSDCL